MPMVICPTTNKWVKERYQVASLSLYSTPSGILFQLGVFQVDTRVR